MLTSQQGLLRLCTMDESTSNEGLLGQPMQSLKLHASSLREEEPGSREEGASGSAACRPPLHSINRHLSRPVYRCKQGEGCNRTGRGTSRE